MFERKLFHGFLPQLPRNILNGRCLSTNHPYLKLYTFTCNPQEMSTLTQNKLMY